jgi:hypothetical protein
MMTRFPFALAALLPATGLLHASEQPLPVEAKQTIAAVHVAAEKGDFRALRKLMKTDFLWSFGGDGSANQAIRAWQESPAELKELARITSLSCAYIRSGLIQCPSNAGQYHRAGFKNTEEGWRMTYFVAGD